ncbi:MAG: hypothetical protein LBC27_06275 [Spirochaetaceae bacterium]|jgi:hypothetical protein|nr:hypothetical protein [Spirochaetaceae bacterium]
MNKAFFSLLALFLLPAALFAQDFGFGDDVSLAAGVNEISGGNSAVSISGEVSASLLGYGEDFHEGADYTRLGNIFSGKLNFAAGNSFGDAVINLKLSTYDFPEKLPISFDEAYLRVYFGIFEIEGGLRKLTWGKADSFGPLDVINPFDYSQITDVNDIMKMKIARPLVHATARIGQFSKLEGVFVPNFEPYRFALSGRWAPVQMADLPATPSFPDASTIEYAQTGFRFTSTIGSSDIGAQYYYGRLPKPAFEINAAPDYSSISVNAIYNAYHQIGVDYAQVLAGFNLRAELAANITDDIEGDNGSVYNPHLLWSLGFDRDIVWGVNLNLQCNETIRLLYDKINENPMLDMEADADASSTRITAALSKKVLQDEFELRFAAIWQIESRDFFLTPALIWIRDAVKVELSGGIFGGDEEGDFGQYHKNNFIKVELTYTF